MFKSLGSIFFLCIIILKEKKLLSENTLNWSKVTDIYSVTEISVSIFCLID